MFARFNLTDWNELFKKKSDKFEMVSRFAVSNCSFEIS